MYVYKLYDYVVFVCLFVLLYLVFVYIQFCLHFTSRVCLYIYIFFAPPFASFTFFLPHFLSFFALFTCLTFTIYNSKVCLRSHFAFG